MAHRVRYINDLRDVSGVPPDRLATLAPVTERFPFRASDYYLSLIDWSDPNDPIARSILPHHGELERWGRLDASDEHLYTRAPNLEHKYGDTALILLSNECGGLCRFCFRKRLFLDGAPRGTPKIDAALAYIRRHKEINNVLLTGGDALFISTERLDRVLADLRAIDHIRIIRVGTRMPAFNPYRIIDDPDLLSVLARHNLPGRPIYVVCQFDHPRELTDASHEAIELCRERRLTLLQQTPMLRGVNDHPELLRDLWNGLSERGVVPYYVFQCRPTTGNRPFAVPVETAFAIFTRAQTLCSGLAKRARFVMSHATGKTEIVGVHGGQTMFKYHRAPKLSDSGRVFVRPSNPEAYWLDDYLHPAHEVQPGRWDQRRRDISSSDLRN